MFVPEGKDNHQRTRKESTMPTRIVLFSHDSVGLGHVKRNLAIAHALGRHLPRLTGQPVAGLLITGESDATDFDRPAGWDWLVVPGITRTGDGYAPRHLPMGMSRVAALRGTLVRAALESFAPDLVIIDRHALGVRRELEAALTQLRVTNPDCRVVLGLREVLDAPKAAELEWQRIGGVRTITSLFDAIWVYGDRGVHDPVASGEIPADLAHLVEYTGYLAHGRPERAEPRCPEPFVLTMVGGGSDGYDLARAAAAAPVPAGYRHLVVTGRQMRQADQDEVAAAAAPGTEVVEWVDQALSLARRAAAVVCMGGYNTISEIMTTTTPALVVPRCVRRQEQRIRAGTLARRSAIDTLPPDQARPATIGEWIAHRAGDRVARNGIDLGGLTRVPELAAALLDRPDDVTDTTMGAAHVV